MKNSEENEMENKLDPQLWSVLAGGVVKTLGTNTYVCYFPQGHGEYAYGEVDFRSSEPGPIPIPSYIVCRVLGVKYLSDRETDEVYARIRLVPVPSTALNDLDEEDDEQNAILDRPMSHVKILTPSDANNGGGFTVPKQCAESIFPALDKSVDPATQKLNFKDSHGKIWPFTHILRGGPKRHLFTTGWSFFVNSKKLVSGDSVIFARTRDGELHIGIRRKPRGTNPSLPSSSSSPTPFSVWNVKKVSPESVMECFRLAIRGQEFEVVYYPRPNAPAFCVKAWKVGRALQSFWQPGDRFKMTFEDEGSLMRRWFMGTVSSVKPIDPNQWPNSVWRAIQVRWDQVDPVKEQNVSPWVIELVVPDIRPLNLSLPPKKRQRQQQQQIPALLPPPSPIFSGSVQPGGVVVPFYNYFVENSLPVGMQGARQDSYGLISSLISSVSNFYNQIQTCFYPQQPIYPRFDYNPLRISNKGQVVSGSGDGEVVSDRTEKDQRISNEGQVVRGGDGGVVSDGTEKDQRISNEGQVVRGGDGGVVSDGTEKDQRISNEGQVVRGGDGGVVSDGTEKDQRISNEGQVVRGGDGGVVSDGTEKDQRMSNEGQVVSGGDGVVSGGDGESLTGGDGGEVVTGDGGEVVSHILLFGVRIEKKKGN